MLTNNPPSAAELYADEIESLKERIRAFGPVTKDNAGDARDLIGLSKKLAKDIDETREVEKKPHLDAGREIDARYKPLVEEAKTAPKPLEQALLNFINEQKRAAEEAARESRRLAEIEAAKMADLSNDPLLGDEAEKLAEMAVMRAEVDTAAVRAANTVRGSEGFRAAGIRKSYKAKVTNYPLLVAHFENHPDVQAAAKKAANAMIRSTKGTVSIPGVEVIEVQGLS